MIVTPIRTEIVTARSITLSALIGTYVTVMPENSVLAISSKVVALCEGSVADPNHTAKDKLIAAQSQCLLPKEKSKYGSTVTLHHNSLSLAAGIDESNSGGLFALWPANPLETAKSVRRQIKDTFGLTNAGVIIIDSTSKPLRIGTVGTSIACAGFKELNSYIGKEDLFRRTITISQANVAENLASAALIAMGEGNEQTPLAVVSDVPFVQFGDFAGSCYELPADTANNDVYAPLWENADWHAGDAGGEKTSGTP